MSAADDRPIPDLLLEKLALGELPEETEQALMARIRADEREAARLERIRTDNARTLERYPAQQMVRAIADKARVADAIAASKAEHEARSGGLALWLAPIAAAAAAVALVLWLWPGQTAAPGGVGAPDGGEGYVGLKGSDEGRLFVYRKAADGAELLEAGADASAGDVLQVQYNAGGAAHGVIVSIDGAGAVTLHFPSTAGGGTALQGGAVNLPAAYELDAAPGFERFFFVTGPEPIDVEAVLAASRRLAADPSHARSAPLDVPGELSWSSLLLRKVEK